MLTNKREGRGSVATAGCYYREVQVARQGHLDCFRENGTRLPRIGAGPVPRRHTGLTCEDLGPRSSSADWIPGREASDTGSGCCHRRKLGLRLHGTEDRGGREPQGVSTPFHVGILPWRVMLSRMRGHQCHNTGGEGPRSLFIVGGIHETAEVG